ncbi:MAG: hypothetical protein KBT12_01525 [Bacteroidales bacterium]|nr:hypothetical protein [Candidatus Physcousia equi]
MNWKHQILKVLHKLYVTSFWHKFDAKRDIPNIINHPDQASEAIFRLLTSDDPCMIARFGSVELMNVNNARSIESPKHSIWRYITNNEREWWWNELNCSQMLSNAGFFPNTKENLLRFAHLIAEDSKSIDLLGSWIGEELFAEDFLPHDILKVRLLYLEPYWSYKPWTKALEGKKVVVVHPFSELIENQYNNHRLDLFLNPDVLPSFQLRVVKAVQSIGGEAGGFADWFEALEWMKAEVDKEYYDIALIGCGAYGFPLAAHCKRQGKKSVHLGGALQLLFGIRGRRWDNPLYGVQEFEKEGVYLQLFNEHWVYPSLSDKPKHAEQVENGCYW